jgi:hypothetical protein
MYTPLKYLIQKVCASAVALALVLITATPPVLAQSVPNPVGPVAAAQAATLDCSKSPFGGILNIGAEREIFISYRGGAAPNQNGLAYTRLDHDPSGQLQHQETWLGKSIEASLATVTAPTAAAADLNADGKVEFVQAFRDAGGNYRLAAHSNGLGTDTYQDNLINHQQLAMAAGNLSRDETKDDEVVIVSRSQANSLTVLLVNGAANGLLPTDGNNFGLWRSIEQFRQSPDLLDVATGDLDGDGHDDEIVVALREEGKSHIQLIVLEYTPNHEQGSGANYQRNVKELGHLRVEASEVLRLQVAMGDFNKDFKDEIVLAFDDETPDRNGYSEAIRVRTYAFDHKNSTTPFTELGRWSNPNVHLNHLALTTGDTDGDGQAEIVVAFANTASVAVSFPGLAVYSLDAETSRIVTHNYWYNGEQERATVADLSIEAADVDRDGLAEIVAGFRDTANWLQVLQLSDTITATENFTLTIQFSGTMGLYPETMWRDGADGRTGANAITIAVADWDNDSLKAQYAPAPGGNLKCKQVIEPQITSAIFVPPFWQNIQGGQYVYSSVGKSRTQEKSNETALTTSYGHSASGYFGAGVGVEGSVFSFESSLKLTAGYEYASETTRTGSQNTGQTLTSGWTNFSPFVVVDSTTANCYSYQLIKNGLPLDGAARFCENRAVTNSSLSLDAWDIQNNSPVQWTPIARDWSNLALFRRDSVAQSSTVDGSPATAALDSNLDGTVANGSVAQTQPEASPWWQVDLGSEQPLTKIRVWNRNNVGCSVASCMNGLADFYVFVSNSDFRTLSNDPNVLKSHPAVQSYHHAGVSGRVTTIRTLDNSFQPTTGRYVRVQLVGSGSLALAEVQVFGPNHVEPDRYPVNVFDDNPNDHWFTVRLFNPVSGQYESVRTRGKLLWNGANQNVLNNERIGDGDSTLSWSLTQSAGGSQSVAESVAHTVKVGAEFEVEAGIIPVKVQTGGSYEYSTGFGREETNTISWEEGFEIDGGVQGFPLQVAGNTVRWPTQCRYGFQPYYYTLTEESDYGYKHTLLVIDYIVPERMLDRSRVLTPCRTGAYKTGVNRAPLAVNDTAFTTPGTAITIDVLANDSDPDNDALTITAVGAASHGAAAVVNNQVFYQPNGGYTGSDTFTYAVDDGYGGVATATVTVQIGQASDPNSPQVFNDLAVAFGSGPVTIAVLENDIPGSCQTLTLTNVAQPANGVAQIVGTTIVYTPNAGFTGTETFSYTVGSPHCTFTATGMIQVNIHAAPVAALYLPVVKP